MQQNYLETELNSLIQSELSTWKFLQEGSLDGVWYWDLEKPDHEWMSPEFWRTFGVDPASKKHDPAEWQDIIFKDDLTVALKNFEAHCADPEHPYDQEVRYLHADGSTVWIRCRGLAIRDEKGKPVRMLGAHTNITRIKQSELDAQRGWAAAEASNEELKSFSYSVSHDMKAPANTLELLLTEIATLNEGKLDAETLEMMTMCSQTVDRMKRLIEYVLDYTRVIGMPPEKEVISLKEAAQNAIANLTADIVAYNAKVNVGPLPDIKAVPMQMEMLLQNLISNGIKYCPADRQPTIDIHSETGSAGMQFKLSVKDNGMGILPENQDRIFKLFQRLHGYSDIPGNGIGLPMCKRIALNHGGTIELTSTPERGSEFSLCLPMEALA